MLDLRVSNKVVGLNQTTRALTAGQVKTIYLALDADPSRIEPLREACATFGVVPVEVATMQELGAACGVKVGAACAALLKE